MSRRSEQIAEQLRAEIARLLRVEVTDPRIGMVTLTRVDVAPDLSQAFVYWSPLETKETEAVEEIASGLESAQVFVRRRLASVLQLRRTPALEFRFDHAFEAGARILDLIGSMNDE